MKPYAYKKKKKIKGDGCFLCTQERKTTKTAIRKQAKKEMIDTLSDHYQAEIDEN